VRLLRINLFTGILAVCVIAAAAAFWLHARDSQQASLQSDFHQSDPKSRDAKYARALAQSIRYSGFYELELYKKYGRDNLLNAVHRLLPEQNPDAEYVDACLFETRGISSGPSNGDFGFINEVYALWRFEVQSATVRRMYEQAYHHGSAQAATALTRFYRDDERSATELYKFAIAHGDEDAKIEYGFLLQDSSPAQAMNLFEEALQAGNQDTVNFAMQSLLRLWQEQNVSPSALLKGDAKTAFDFAHKFNPKLTPEDFTHLLIAWGCTPEPYDGLRWQVMENIRKGCGFHSGCAEIQP
jgi:hypothetical protein